MVSGRCLSARPSPACSRSLCASDRFIKSDLVDALSDETIWKTCQLFHTVPDGCTWLFELSGAALTDCKTTCLPKTHRDAAYTIAALHQWPVDVPKEDVKCVTTAIDWIDKIIHPASPGGPLPCVSVEAAALRACDLLN
jgi:hypothetical protein